jgi:hypothetical protein
MKKYRGDERVVLEHPTNMKKTNIIVWIGSSEYWDMVFLNPKDHRLYIRTAFGRYELLDTFNIRNITIE